VRVNPYSEDDIGEAILALLHDPDRRAELSRRARERARTFTWRQVAEQTLQVYRKVAR